MAPAVLVENLRKSYGPVTAVEDVSFQIEPGEIFGLLGPNGAGKTTTIRCLCTLTQPDGGRIELLGVSVLADPCLARTKLGYVAQEVALDKILTGRELLQLQAALYHLPRPLARERIEQAIEVLGLIAWVDRKTGGYSGGQRRRLDLAAGFLHQPPVLVLDEPTVGLDIESRVAVWRFLRQLKEMGTTILLSSHHLEEVDALADRVGIIDRGKLVATGTPTALKAQLGGDRITLRIREFTPELEVQRAQEVLDLLPFVQTVIVNGDQGNTLNLVVKPQGDALGQIQQTLQEAGLPIFSLAQAHPSLDDVYLAATGHTLMDAELASAGSRDAKAELKQNMR